MRKEKALFVILLLWLLIGLIFGLDYTTYSSSRGIDAVKYGINTNSLVFRYQLLFFLESAILIFIAFRSDNRNFQKVFVIIELVIWLIRLLLIKDGYMVGYGGAPDEGVVIYDFISLVLRFLLLRSYFTSYNKAVSLIAVFVAASLFIYLKIYIFSEPIYYLSS
ncbi:hypothetical protein [Rufibacter quisquiliarum]|uniref:Uncharacterized protein n=1 Tax=Rufibacter quisquiliarum TaxID=1549639 RepID=A0A839GBZ2_9BACT|nr:hypothetical protein [Rufibacter quisquiliarum]MBA9077104.1 hypothetical protein [Rufibacter quisquiliarum]